jgi:hypothetical protein
MSHRFSTLALAAGLAACGPAAPVQAPEPGPKLGSVASVRLFDATGPELTQHLPLPAGRTIRLAVRLYAPDGREIIDIQGVELGFTFNPGTLASSAPVSDEPLSRDITTTSPAGTHGFLTVSVRAPEYGLNRSFGPFDALIH